MLGQFERHETPDPARSDAVKPQFQRVRETSGRRPGGVRLLRVRLLRVRQRTDLHDQHKLPGIELQQHERSIYAVRPGTVRGGCCATELLYGDSKQAQQHHGPGPGDTPPDLDQPWGRG
jgi:hypothetical protein